jgi:hypothetical protein
MPPGQPLEARDRATILAAQSAAIVEHARALRAASQALREQRVRAATCAYRQALQARYAGSAEDRSPRQPRGSGGTTQPQRR